MLDSSSDIPDFRREREFSLIKPGYVPGIMWGNLYPFSYSIFTATQGDGGYHSPLTDEETEVQRG